LFDQQSPKGTLDRPFALSDAAHAPSYVAVLGWDPNPHSAISRPFLAFESWAEVGKNVLFIHQRQRRWMEAHAYVGTA
jgi:hypothetical protein